MSVVLTQREKYKRVRNALVTAYRTKRETPRAGALPPYGPRDFEDPAPAWVFTTVDAILPSIFDASHDFGFGLLHDILEWCGEGNPEARALQVQGIARLWLGDGLVEVLARFMGNARATRGGKRGKTRNACRCRGCPCALPKEIAEDLEAKP